MTPELQRRSIPIFLSAAGAAVTVGLLSACGLLRTLEWSALDTMLRLRPAGVVSQRVVLVAIDEPDIAAIGTWPVPDGVLAAALEKLQQHEPQAIGIDLYRDLPLGGGGSTLNRVLRENDNIFGVEKVLGQRIQPSPALAATTRVGFSEVIVDRDRTVRRALLSLRDRKGDGRIKSSLAVRLALHYLAADGITLEVVDADKQHYQLGRAEFLPLTGRGYLYRGEDIGGYQILANWYGDEKIFPRIAFQDILADRFDPTLVRDRVVIVGTVAESTKDLFATPHVPHQTVPGALIHADFVRQLLAGALEGRPTALQVLPQAGEWAWIGVWSLAAAALSWRLKASHRLRHWPLHTPIGIALLSTLLILGNYGIFRGASFVLPTISPLVAVSLGAIAAANTYKQDRLATTNAALAATNARLQDYSRTLEERVQARTQDLARARDAATAASQAKSQFLAHMSHELRTPLNAILGYAELLERQPELPQSARRQLGIVRRSGEHLLQLIGDVLSIAKIEADRVELDLEDCHLRRLLQGLEEMLALKAASKGIALALEIEPQVPERVCLDAGKLRQIVLNLLSNAVKFTERGRVVLKVRWHPGGKADGVLAFAVIDTGTGIATADLERIFEPFAQAENGRAQAEGTGLGLSIGRRFVRLLGGELIATSELGRGSTFEFDLPVTLPVAMPIETPSSTAASNAGAAAATATVPPSDLLADLSQIHPACLRRFQQAVALLDIDEMLGIVAGIASERPALATALSDLIEDFHYEKLGSLLQAAMDSSNCEG